MALSGVALFKAGHRKISTKNSQIWRTELFFFFGCYCRQRTTPKLSAPRWVAIWFVKPLVTPLHIHSMHRALCLQRGLLSWWRKDRMTGYRKRGRAFWVRSWLQKGPDCQVTCNDVRAQHNPKTPASQPANKSLNNNRKITKLRCQSCSFRPLPFTWNRKNSRKRAYILKDSRSILFLPFGNKVLTSKETVLWMSPAAFPWGVFFGFLFKAVWNYSEQGIIFFFFLTVNSNCAWEKQEPLREGKYFAPFSLSR